MTSIADYFKNIPGENDSEVRQKAVQDNKSAYSLGENTPSKTKHPLNVQKTENTVAEFVGSKNRQKFHRRDCEWAAYLLNSRNLVTFSSYQEATQAGYKPCRTCIDIREVTQKNS